MGSSPNGPLQPFRKSFQTHSTRTWQRHMFTKRSKTGRTPKPITRRLSSNTRKTKPSSKNSVGSSRTFRRVRPLSTIPKSKMISFKVQQDFCTHHLKAERFKKCWHSREKSCSNCEKRKRLPLNNSTDSPKATRCSLIYLRSGWCKQIPVPTALNRSKG